jgi:hypothetical protein
VAGRELVFAHPEVIRLAAERFVPVATDDWYQRRRQDAVGAFFRGVADQGPRKGEGGSTRQGIYCFTPSGKLLAYRNHHDPQVILAELRKALDAWDRLPESERGPGAVEVPELASRELDRNFVRTPPTADGGLIARVHTRTLERDEDGSLRACSRDAASRPNSGALPARDHLWVTAEESRSLVPDRPAAGESFPLPAAIAERLLRFHLIDNTRGEPPMWRREDIRAQSLKLTVVASDGTQARLRLDGHALLATAADPKQADRGYDVHLLGYIDVDRASGRVERFEVAALGEHWGDGPYTRNARPGRARWASSSSGWTAPVPIISSRRRPPATSTATSARGGRQGAASP